MAPSEHGIKVDVTDLDGKEAGVPSMNQVVRAMQALKALDEKRIRTCDMAAEMKKEIEEWKATALAAIDDNAVRDSRLITVYMAANKLKTMESPLGVFSLSTSGAIKETKETLSFLIAGSDDLITKIKTMLGAYGLGMTGAKVSATSIKALIEGGHLVQHEDGKVTSQGEVIPGLSFAKRTYLKIKGDVVVGDMFDEEGASEEVVPMLRLVPKPEEESLDV